MRGTTYSLSVLGLVALMLGAVASFNYVVDPYDLNQRLHWSGVNLRKPLKRGHDRLLLPVTIQERQPRTLLMGTSRAYRGLGTDHPAQATGAPVMNIALPGGAIGEVARLFEHAVTVAPVKQAVLGLDFFSFSASYPITEAFDEARLRRLGKWPTLAQRVSGTPLDPAYFSYRTLRDGILTVLDQRPESGGGGAKTAQADAPPTETRALFRHVVRLYRVDPAMDGGFTFGAAEPMDSPGIMTFRRLLATARAGRVEMHLFISPIHSTLLVALQRSGHMADFERWKLALAAAVAEDTALHPGEKPFRLIDFSGVGGDAVVPRSGSLLAKPGECRHRCPVRAAPFG